MHTTISPAILYFGTPIVLISTLNPDGTPNLAPLSSAWWLSHRCLLGLDASSCTTQNLLRTKQCVLNLPTDSMGPAINALARTTGTEIVSESKLDRGYSFVKDKFGHAGLTAQGAELVDPPRVKECPVQMEAELIGVHEMMADQADRKGLILAIEVKIVRVYVEEELRLAGHANRVNADKWRPMIMCFQDMYGLAEGKVVMSRLAEIEEEKYRALTQSTVVVSRVL
ncbi:MAG: hypothetical protein MMC33_008630 [Icmadophila ericetorum]|nr:hypothetical protein [Icmadophila ericetorum]